MISSDMFGATPPAQITEPHLAHMCFIAGEEAVYFKLKSLLFLCCSSVTLVHSQIIKQKLFLKKVYEQYIQKAEISPKRTIGQQHAEFW